MRVTQRPKQSAIGYSVDRTCAIHQHMQLFQNCFRTVSETQTTLQYRVRKVQNCFRTASETQQIFRAGQTIVNVAFVKHSMPMPTAYQDNTSQQQLPKPLVETYLHMVASSNNQGMANNSASMRRPQRCQSDFAEQPWQCKV